MWWSFICSIFCILFIIPGKYKLVFLKSKKIHLGSLQVDETTILEWKPLFSLKTFYFHEGEAQEIFHTHSFTALSLLLHGNYIESFYNEKTNQSWEEPRNRSRMILIPRDRFHQITKSNGCRTIMLTGPWGDTYREYNPESREFITSTHGRKEISRLRF
jgi:hypothetical protein